MKTRRLIIALFLLAVSIFSACAPAASGSIQSTTAPTAVLESTSPPIPTAGPTLTPLAVNYSAIVQDFAGKWIGYSVITGDTNPASKQKTGMRLEITSDRLMVDGQTCVAPEYASKTITLKEFLSGLKQPDTSIELNQDEFPLLQSNCPNIEPSAVALVNPRTLAARVGDAILFFERDASVAEDGLSVTTNLVSDSNNSPKYEVHAQVPQLELPQAEKFNQLVRSLVDEELTSFKKNFDDWQIPDEMSAYTSFMWIGYDVPLLTQDLISIRLTVDWYMAGAAHPNHYFRVVNYDLAADKEILFDDLFLNENKALNFLAKTSKAILTKPDLPLFEEGLLPKKENFVNWNLTRTGLRLSFNPSDVAPYAAGAQEVLIPFDDIQELANPDTAAGRFILHK